MWTEKNYEEFSSTWMVDDGNFALEAYIGFLTGPLVFLGAIL